MGTTISTESNRTLFEYAYTSSQYWMYVFYGILRHGVYPLVMCGLCNLSTIMFKHKHKSSLMMRTKQKGDKKEQIDPLEKETSNRWSKHLPQEIMELILMRLCLNDYLRVGTVCSSWRSAVARAITQERCPPAPKLPLLLMFNSIPEWNLISDDHTLFNLWSDGGGSSRVSRLCHANLSRQHFCGSIEGWLIITDSFMWRPDGLFSDFLSIAPLFIFRWFRFEKVKNFFYNPISRAKVMLPSQLTIPCLGTSSTMFFNKVVASSVPKSSNCIVAALSSHGDLIFCRPSDKRWTLLYDSNNVALRFTDIVIHGGKLYAMTYDAHAFVTVFDLFGDCKAKVIEMLHPLPVVNHSLTIPEPHVFIGSSVSHLNFVVDFHYGELLLIMSIVDFVYRDDSSIDHDYICPPKAKSFQVFRLDESGPGLRWVQLDTLGNRILFISPQHSKCIPASDIGDYCKKELIRGNCIYFAFDNVCWDSPSLGRDVGMFSLVDGSIKRNLIPVVSRSWTTRWPLWFTPNPW